MKLGLTALAVFLAALLPTTAHAQVLKPLDLTKQADVNNKVVTFGEVQFDSLSQPTSVLPSSSPLSKGKLKFHDVDQKKAEFNTLEMSTISRPTLPKANFTTRSAAVDVPSGETKKQAEQTKKQAQINERQIHPLTPGGEEELKHQLNEPPLEVH